MLHPEVCPQLASISFTPLPSEKNCDISTLFYAYLETEKLKKNRNDRKLVYLLKQCEVYVSDTFSFFQTLHPLSQSARSRAKFSIRYDTHFFFDYVKTPLFIFVNMPSVLVFSLLLFSFFLLIIDAEYWIPMYKKDTPCKLEKRFDNIKHFNIKSSS